MSDEGPSPRGPKVNMEPGIVGESGDVKDEAKKMRMENVRERENKENFTTNKVR